MTWNQVGSWNITQPETTLPLSFSSRLVFKITNVAGLKPTWNWTGFFYQYLDIPDIGLTRIDKKIYVPTTEPILFVPEIFKPNYTFKFFLNSWITSLTLTIYEDSMPLNFEPVVNIPNTSASTANSVTVPISAASVTLLAANPNRKKLVIANNCNQDLYIDLDATSSIADHAIKIPKLTAGGFIATYELEEYTGVISGIWAAAGTGAALIREMV
jgi:hypothetical protein